MIIPAFSVGRTQELVYFLNQMISEGDLPGLPVFVDSPLAVNASDVFSRHAELFDEETRQFIREDAPPGPGLQRADLHSLGGGIQGDQRPARPDGDHLGFGHGRNRAHPAPPEEQYREPAQHDPDRLVAGAGYARAAAWPTAEPRVHIFGESYALRAEVATIGGLSAHAGQDVLVKYALSSHASLRKIFLVHGEEAAANALQAKLAEARLSPVYYPERGQTFEL